MNVVLSPRNGLSLCAGGGGLDMGLMLLEPEFHTRCFVEWEKYPRESLIAAQRHGYFARAPIWDDVTTFDGKPFCGAFDTILAGYPCFISGTIICTKRGHIPIEKVIVGDFVLTHKGRWRRVNATMGKRNAPVRTIKAQGVPGITCTDEHTFYQQTGEWIPAKEIKRGTKLGQVLPDIICDEHTDEFWWVIGRYIADGWRQWSPSRRHKKGGRISICCARHEADELESRIIAAGFKPYRSEERTTTRFAITRHELYEFCEQFGKGASGKNLPGWVLGLEPKKAKALCRGYFSGDGYRYKNSSGIGGGWRITTVSRGLALSFAALSQRAFGVVASVRKQEVPPFTTIEGRTVNQRNQYILQVPDRNRSGKIIGRYGWKHVRSNERCGNADVYNIGVQQDESYVADGAIVHNCQPFSQAGQRKGEDDERHLWPDIARIIREVKPTWVILENVSGHVTLGAETVLRDLHDMGFKTAVILFTASETGSPQKRERWLCVAYSDSNALLASRRGVSEPNGRDNAGRRSGKTLANTERAQDHRERGYTGRDRKSMDRPREATFSDHRKADTNGLDGRCADVGNASRIGFDKGWSEPIIRGRGNTVASTGGTVADTRGDDGQVSTRRPNQEWDSEGAERIRLDASRSGSVDSRELAHPDSSGFQRKFTGQRYSEGWQKPHEPIGHGGRASVHPPGPSEALAWAEIIGVAPNLAPATSFGDAISYSGHLAQMVAAGNLAETEAEHRICGMVNGMAGRSRQLKLYGNGVHPLGAANAMRALFYALGHRSLDMDAAGRVSGSETNVDV